MRSMLVVLRTFVVVLGGMVSLPALAQKPPAALSVEKLTPNLYVLGGAGGNIAVHTGTDVTYLVDDGLQPIGDAVKAELAKISSKPVRFVINTHWHKDHTGNNPLLGEAGAVIVAHDNVRKRLSTGGLVALFKQQVPPTPAIGLPVVTFSDSVTLHLNGQDVDVVHVPPAHTDGDSVVWFDGDDVVHMGDTFLSKGYPFVDLSSGGDYQGFLVAADKVLARIKDTTKVIPGHGPVVGKAQLAEWRYMLATIGNTVRTAVEEKKTLAQVQAMRPTAQFDAKYADGFIKPEQLVEFAYRSYSKPVR